jgi:serine/threonine-protein phosphatase 4 regulatory subunit 1
MTDSDLVIVFDGFLKDLDEVRIGVLSHFSEFLELVSLDHQKRYLAYLPNFQQMDNSNNWRFRQALAEQLGQLCSLCEPLDIHKHVVPIAINLATDKVADVRLLAIEVLGKSLCYLKQGVDTKLADQLAEDIRNRFALSSRWLVRQTFVRFCQSLIAANYVSPLEFAENFLDPMLDLVSDSVANVRIAVSRTIAENLLSIDLFKPTETNMSPHALSVSLAITRLIKDTDQDVRNFLVKLGNTAGSEMQDKEESLEMSVEVEDSSLSDAHDHGNSAEQSIVGQGNGSEESAGDNQA